MRKQVVILMSHFFDTYFIRGKYQRLREELDVNRYDVVLLFNANNKVKAMDIIPDTINAYVYDIDDLNELGYTPICGNLLPGSCHFPVLRFYLDHPSYSYYWLIEYDVDFTGKWSNLMDSFDYSNSDFVATYMTHYNVLKNRGWMWWNKSNKMQYPVTECIRGFHPICRYSNRALNYIDQYQKKGYSAHSEVLIATCLYHAGMELEDFGGTGEFVKLENKNKFYIIPTEQNIGTFCYRPVYPIEYVRDNGIREKLYHPIKPRQ